MPYVTRAKILVEIPEKYLVDALDDNNDGSEDEGLFDSLVEVVGTEIDGYLCGLFTVPFSDPVPAKVQAAAYALLGDLLYRRRQRADNPFDGRAKMWREHLTKVGNRELPFAATVSKVVVPGAVITSDAAVNAQST